jgi:hypothetical protein
VGRRLPLKPSARYTAPDSLSAPYRNVLESWRETFDMEMTDDGAWTWKPFWEDHWRIVDKTEHGSESGPSVWTGRALQAESDDLEVMGLALLYPALERNVCVPGHHGYPRALDLIRVSAPKAIWAT